MTTPRVSHQKQAETLNYQPGGFHPVHLGDLFKKDRYNVIHKLGHGGFATVWLARDSKRNRYVALKILAARLSNDCPEVKILRHIKDAPGHDGKLYVMCMLDHFWITGPNGKHLCIVSQVCGPSIKQFNECPGQSSGTRRLRAAVARRIALQATKGLAYIHSTGTVHGDFTAANILLQLANIDEWSEEQIHERLGKPQLHEIEHAAPLPSGQSDPSSAPKYTIDAIDMKKVDPQFLSDQIMIIDFGIAFPHQEFSYDIGTPKSYCAPEFLFEGSRSFSSDIWALGCTIFEIRTGSRLFRYSGKPSRNQILIAMVKLLGTLPEVWWRKWKEGISWYATERQKSDELTESSNGSLYHQIMDIGLHDGERSSKPPKDESLENKYAKPTDKHVRHTNHIIAMVEELTTSEAVEVVLRMNKSSSGSVDEDNTATVSSGKAVSGSGSNGKSNPGSKSGDKSISSEGVPAGNTGDAGRNSDSIKAGSDGQNENVIGDDSRGAAGSTKISIATTHVQEFLEPDGKRITASEAKELEELLRGALNYLPEDRLPPSELAKHSWFFDMLED